MRRLFFLLPLLLLLGCEQYHKHRLAGTYYRSGDAGPMGAVQQLRLTDDKVHMAMPIVGEVAFDYTVDGNTIYLGGPEGQIRFTVDGLGIISNKGTMGYEGTYIRQVVDPTK
jgi:hypothetical protein